MQLTCNISRYITSLSLFFKLSLQIHTSCTSGIQWPPPACGPYSEPCSPIPCCKWSVFCLRWMGHSFSTLVCMITQRPVGQAGSLTVYQHALVRDQTPSVVRSCARAPSLKTHPPAPSLFHPNLYNKQANKFHTHLADSAACGREGRWRGCGRGGAGVSFRSQNAGMGVWTTCSGKKSPMHRPS